MTRLLRRFSLAIAFQLLLEASGVAQGCELPVAQQSAEGTLYLYLLRTDRRTFKEIALDPEAKPGDSALQRLVKALADLPQECQRSYLNRGYGSTDEDEYETTAEEMAGGLVRQLAAASPERPMTLSTKPAMYFDYTKGTLISAFLRRLPSWETTIKLNGITRKEANSLKSQWLLLPGDERVVKLIWVDPSGLDSNNETGLRVFGARDLLSTLGSDRASNLVLAQHLANEETRRRHQNPDPPDNASVDPEVVPAVGLFDRVHQHLTALRPRQWLILLLMAVLAGAALASFLRWFFETWRLLGHARRTRLEAVARFHDPFGDSRVTSYEGAAEVLKRQSRVLLKLAGEVGEAVSGDRNSLMHQGTKRFVPTEAELEGALERIRRSLQNLSAAGEEKTWAVVIEHLRERNNKLGFEPIETDRVSSSEDTFDSLLALAANELEGLRSLLDGHLGTVDGKGPAESYAELLQARSDRVKELQGQLADSMELLAARFAGSYDDQPAQRLQSFLEEISDPAVEQQRLAEGLLLEQSGIPAGGTLVERLRAAFDALHKAESSLRQTLEAGLGHLDTYYRLTKTPPPGPQPTAVASSREAATHLLQGLDFLAGEAKRLEDSAQVYNILRLTMQSIVHLNQAISIWRGTGGGSTALRLLVLGFDKLNLYALGLVEGGQLKSAAAAELLAGSADHKGRLPAILRVLGVILTLRAYPETWNGLRRDVRNGLERTAGYIDELLREVGLKAHAPALLGNVKTLDFDTQIEKSAFVLEEADFRQELGVLWRRGQIADDEVVVEISQLGFEVEPEGLLALLKRSSPTYLCTAGRAQLERLARVSDSES